MIDTSFSEEVWMYNLHTVGAKEVVSPQGKGLKSVDYEKLLNGFSTSVAAWLMLAGPDKKSIGGTRRSLGGRDKKKGIDKTTPGGWCTANDNKTWDSEQNTCDKDFDNTSDRDLMWDLHGARARWCDVMRTLRNTPRDSEKFGDKDLGPSNMIAETLKWSNSQNFNCGPNGTDGCTGNILCPLMTNDSATALILSSLINLSGVSAKCGKMGAFNADLINSSPKSCLTTWTAHCCILSHTVINCVKLSHQPFWRNMIRNG
jgi:hypothetical protein